MLLPLGAAGLMSAERYPMNEWQPQFSAMAPAGAMCVFLYAATWFWDRRRTRDDAVRLRERWPEG